jgi:hypothetical protein
MAQDLIEVLFSVWNFAWGWLVYWHSSHLILGSIPGQNFFIVSEPAVFSLHMGKIWLVHTTTHVTYMYVRT